MEPVPIPGTEEFVFKKGFIERYSQLTNWEEFRRYSLCFLRRSIRVNTLLGTVKDVKKSIESKGWKLEPIPWCKEGFWISHPDRRDVGHLLEHQLGYVYVQEAASMIPPVVLNPVPGDIVLDMCAAPGSKTTQMGAMMENRGLVIANDFKGNRLQALGINVQRSGLTNVLITLMHGNGFRDFQFDKILLDAPCSGTGTIRKSLHTIHDWNQGMIASLSRQQKQLIERAYLNLKPGGVLVYSTCTLEPEENEGVVDYLLKKYPDAAVVPVVLKGLKTGSPVLEFAGIKYDPSIKQALRIWPQDNDTEGFFVVKIRKRA
ncbi:MAG: RsmB/NOP family class I SAM-dependent RNA methyltransferase [Candidatus Aenigmarchaeota archaeon]|nr:MAG: nucleolar protein I [archaeon GW2011_AR9]MBS3053860.1 RsmB/NOP family class I SAM-dependent RNA methyltransferase [Candidatus Aenigmarchaeota archaeon]MBS3120996.1 RsmB/NOP family class I SAM-dependent RNA methyltransferase [Candidatus Woesearchaeota archaeon]